MDVGVVRTGVDKTSRIFIRPACHSRTEPVGGASLCIHTFDVRSDGLGVETGDVQRCLRGCNWQNRQAHVSDDRQRLVYWRMEFTRNEDGKRTDDSKAPHRQQITTLDRERNDRRS